MRGHLAAKIDPLNLSNMSIDAAKKLIIRSVQVQEQDLDTVFQLPSTTWIGGSVSIKTNFPRFFFSIFYFSGKSFATERNNFSFRKSLLRIDRC